jgi:hypothetical protein
MVGMLETWKGLESIDIKCKVFHHTHKHYLASSNALLSNIAHCVFGSRS